MASLRRELVATWSETDALFSLLDSSAWSESSIPIHHPFCFYLGHLPTFAHHQVGVSLLGQAPVDAELDALFALGVDPLDAKDKRLEQWPDLSRICSYRDQCRERVLDSFESLAELDDSDPLVSGGRIYHVVIEHEAMHQESLLHMLAALHHSKKIRPPSYRLPTAANAPQQAYCYVPAGQVQIGAAWQDEPFLWDNETPPQVVDLRGFHIQRWPVSNAAYARFVDVGGYHQRGWWDDEGWDWICASGLEQPTGWQGKGDQRTVRSTFEDVDFAVAASWPTEVSHVEAAAFARFSGGRLPSEPELRRAALTDNRGMRRFPWGDDAPDADRANMGRCHWSQTPIGSHPAGSSAWDVEELIGGGWEWTSTVWAALPGFRAWVHTYPGYSADFFDGRHRAMFGASWATPKRLVRPSFRNWFDRRYPYVFSKFRVVRAP